MRLALTRAGRRSPPTLPPSRPTSPPSSWPPTPTTTRSSRSCWTGAPSSPVPITRGIRPSFRHRIIKGQTISFLLPPSCASSSSTSSSTSCIVSEYIWGLRGYGKNVYIWFFPKQRSKNCFDSRSLLHRPSHNVHQCPTLIRVGRTNAFSFTSVVFLCLCRVA